MKTIEEIFLEVFNEGVDPKLPHLMVATKEEIEDIVTTGMDYDYFKMVVRKYAEQAIDRCYELKYYFDDVGDEIIQPDHVLKVKEELK